MPQDLPPEVLLQILTPALSVTGDLFAESTRSGTWARYGESPSAYLLVCNAWYRVGAPLLYSVVVLRSKPQAAALAHAVVSNKELGPHIKRLRVEGGYGASMEKVLLSAKNIVALFLCFNHIHGTDSTEGLCRGLSHINPATLIVDDDGQRRNKHLTALTNAIVETIPRWEKLTCFDITHFYQLEMDRQHTLTARISTISASINAARRLRTLVLAEHQWADAAYDLFQDCPLHTLRVKRPILPSKDPELQGLRVKLERNGGVLLRTLFFRNDRAEPDVPAQTVFSLNPHFVPMANESSDVQEMVWSHVLSFVFTAGWGSLRPLLVCKMFMEAGLPHLYTRITLPTRQHVYALARSVQAHAEYGAYIRELTLTLSTTGRPWAVQELFRMSDDEASVYNASLQYILARCLRLETFASVGHTGHAVRWDHIATITATSNTSMRELIVNVTEEPEAVIRDVALVFDMLSNLHALELRCKNVLLPSDSDPLAPPRFTQLTQLTLDFPQQPLTGRFMKCEFPVLRRLILGRGVDPAQLSQLVVSGPHIDFLSIAAETLIIPGLGFGTAKATILHSCPKLAELVVSATHSPLQAYTLPAFLPQPGTAHTCLAILRIEMPLDRGYAERMCKEFLQPFATRVCPQLPGLREVALSEPVTWPTTEREIDNSVWVQTAEMLLAVGVEVSDSAKVRWRKRLGPSTREMRTPKRGRRTAVPAVNDAMEID
ncbi:HEME-HALOPEROXIDASE domain-containing protein [Mycena indigotica]|uniref:HEME-HALOPEROXIDASE domain-containing protein n=1 Tax=Mycena indigotica TaxID=2126181 RepID=A0A8H6RZT0_9AGAR|nr:HEME-HALOPEROXIDASE domain-containing protein [Mycena indigotica]KAF7290720.1 HEME-HALOPEROXIDASE domain-containing protein [Mycena indigotica]